MNKIELNEKEYELVEENKDCFNYDEVKELCTDYFVTFDYIFGDYAYGKLRLKGFFDKNNKKVQKINDISILKSYIKDYCAPECAYFLLKKKINVEK